jgi:hypothetical protein
MADDVTFGRDQVRYHAVAPVFLPVDHEERWKNGPERRSTEMYCRVIACDFDGTGATNGHPAPERRGRRGSFLSW